MKRISANTARTIDSNISFFSKGVLLTQHLAMNLKPKAKSGSFYLTITARKEKLAVMLTNPVRFTSNGSFLTPLQYTYLYILSAYSGLDTTFCI